MSTTLKVLLRLRLCSSHDQSKTPASSKKQVAGMIRMANATTTASIVLIDNSASLRQVVAKHTERDPVEFLVG